MYLMRGYYPKYRKNPHNSIAKNNQTKNNKSINKEAKDLSRRFSKDKRMAKKNMEKMLNITCHYRNANQNRNEIPFHAC